MNLKSRSCVRLMKLSICLLPFAVSCGRATKPASDVESIEDASRIVQRQDGNFDVSCKSGVLEIATPAQISSGQICTVKPAEPLNILSMQLRGDGRYDVVCVDGMRRVASSEQIRTSNVCSSSPPPPLPPSLSERCFLDWTSVQDCPAPILKEVYVGDCGLSHPYSCIIIRGDNFQRGESDNGRASRDSTNFFMSDGNEPAEVVASYILSRTTMKISIGHPSYASRFYRAENLDGKTSNTIQIKTSSIVKCKAQWFDSIYSSSRIDYFGTAPTHMAAMNMARSACMASHKDECQYYPSSTCNCSSIECEEISAEYQ
jgi:hypothetical protein